jgi:Mn-containing catalase
MTDDPGMKDMLSFLIARDTMHQQQWMAALEDAGDTFRSAPNDVPDEGDYRQYAYSFFGHGEEAMPADARWTSGPSPDGQGEFEYVDAPRLGQEPELMAGPPSVHAGVEATRTNGNGSGADNRGMVEKAVDKLT